jgi:hypothetical protein
MLPEDAIFSQFHAGRSRNLPTERRTTSEWGRGEIIGGDIGVKRFRDFDSPHDSPEFFRNLILFREKMRSQKNRNRRAWHANHAFSACRLRFAALISSPVQMAEATAGSILAAMFTID